MKNIEKIINLSKMISDVSDDIDNTERQADSIRITIDFNNSLLLTNSNLITEILRLIKLHRQNELNNLTKELKELVNG